MAGDAALGAAQQPAAEVRQVEVERDALVVEHELAAHDHEPLDRDAEAAAPPPPPPSFGMSSPPGPSGGEGKAWMRRRRPSRRTRESTMRLPRQRRDARAHAHRVDLEEWRRVGRDAAHAQAAQLELAGREPQAEAPHAHRPLEGARERRLDEVRAPCGARHSA